jgi:hypothetical protein
MASKRKPLWGLWNKQTGWAFDEPGACVHGQCPIAYFNRSDAVSAKNYYNDDVGSGHWRVVRIGQYDPDRKAMK